MYNSLFFTIVSRGKANAVLRTAEEHGATGGTIFLGEGTAHSKLLERLGLTETEKEILMIPASDELEKTLHQVIGETFTFSKRDKGIAFSIPFRRWKEPKTSQDNDIRGKNNNWPYSCIITIVDKGRSKECIKAAADAGARGGTVVHGRGAGVPQDYYFPLVIEPQKDIVMVITTRDKTVPIREKIYADLELEKAGSGIIFTLPVSRASGLLLENQSEERKAVD